MYSMLRGSLERQLAEADFHSEDTDEEELRDISGRARFTHITHQMQQSAAEKIGGFMTGAALFAGGVDKENMSA